MIAALLPCPFCGHEHPEFERMGDRRQSCIVICGNCGARHESGDEGSRNGSSWNQRSEPGQDGLRATLETALARIKDMLADDDGQAFKEARKFLESARQLSEQPEGMKLVPASPTMEVRKHLEGKVGADFLIAYADWCRPLTASPTAQPSVEPVGERDAFEADPELTPAAFAERLARHMKVASLTAKEVSELTGVSETTLSRLKNHGRMPDAISYAALCNFMGWHPHIKHRLAARTTPPPAPVLSDAEIDAITVAQWGDRVVTAAYRAYARAILGRASRGAK